MEMYWILPDQIHIRATLDQIQHRQNDGLLQAHSIAFSISFILALKGNRSLKQNM